MANRKKNYAMPKDDTGQAEDVRAYVNPPMTTRLRIRGDNLTVDFNRMYGIGCDDLAAHVHRLLWSWCQAGGKIKANPTIFGYAESHIIFQEYLAHLRGQGQDVQRWDIDYDTMEGFVSYLGQRPRKKSKDGMPLAYTTQRAIYTGVKSVLGHLCRSKLLPPAKDIFPVNPFPLANKRRKGQSSFSASELKRLIAALVKDILALDEGKLIVAMSEQLTIHLLFIAARTGRNLTPLIELSRDALKPHPIRPTRFILTTYKRRGNRNHLQPFELRLTDAGKEELIPVKSDLASLYNKVLAMTEPLLAEVRADDAKVHLHNALWLFRREDPESIAGGLPGEVTALTIGHLQQMTERLVARHDLRGDDGKPLKVNVSRLRKTFINRLYWLSGGDPVVAARLGGNTVNVVNSHYLEVTPEQVRNHKWCGIALVDSLRGNGNGEQSPSEGQGTLVNSSVVAVKANISKTGVASCRDTKNGRYAPKDGTDCMDFLSCFRCPDQIVTGDDLWRMFSFYWLLVRERNLIGARKWTKMYYWVIREIDDAIAPMFPEVMVNAALKRAHNDPHPMWRDRAMLGGAA